MREKDRKDSTSSEEQDEEDGTFVKTVKTTKEKVTTTSKEVTTTEHGGEGSLIGSIFWVVDKSFSIICMGVVTLLAITVATTPRKKKYIFITPKPNERCRELEEVLKKE